MEAAQVFDPVDSIGHRLTQHPAISRRRDEDAGIDPIPPACLGTDRRGLAGVGRTDLYRRAQHSGHNQSADVEQQSVMISTRRRRHAGSKRARHKDCRAAIGGPEKGRAPSIKSVAHILSYE